jgi:DNA-binding response OmpR family regulator
MPVLGTVLVVEDEPSIRLLCRVNLELEGYRLLEAATLDEARRALAAEHVDVVLLDVHLAGEDGRVLLRELAERDPVPPVAMLTGTSELDDDVRRSVDAVLPKPFTLEQLIETVRRLANAQGEASRHSGTFPAS